MEFKLFLFLLVISTFFTIVLTNALKGLLNLTDTLYRPNVVVLDGAMISCTGMAVLYRLPFGLGFEPILLYRLVVLIVCTWFTSMVVYDKIVQTKKQFKKHKQLKNARR